MNGSNEYDNKWFWFAQSGRYDSDSGVTVWTVLMQ